jgi:hypothetical protein
MTLANALDAALKLKAALTTEVHRSKDVRKLLKTINSEQLLAQASLREAFNQYSAYLSAELGRAIAAYAATQGLADITLDELCRRAPFEGEQLRSIFAELRALSASLAELDAFNQQLAQQALTFVRAYVTHLAPRPTAYNRRGLPPSLEGATHSEHA